MVWGAAETMDHLLREVSFRFVCNVLFLKKERNNTQTNVLANSTLIPTCRLHHLSLSLTHTHAV